MKVLLYPSGKVGLVTFTFFSDGTVGVFITGVATVIFSTGFGVDSSTDTSFGANGVEITGAITVGTEATTGFIVLGNVPKITIGADAVTETLGFTFGKSGCINFILAPISTVSLNTVSSTLTPFPSCILTIPESFPSL